MRPCYWKDERQVAIWSRFFRAKYRWRTCKLLAWELCGYGDKLDIYNPDVELMKRKGLSEVLCNAAREFVESRSAYLTEMKMPCKKIPCPYCAG